MGFGLHVGWAIEGAIGSEYKIDASYLSPNVNMASRLEAATKQFGTTLLMSEDFVCMLSPFVRRRVRQIDCVTVKVSPLPSEATLQLKTKRNLHEVEGSIFGRAQVCELSCCMPFLSLQKAKENPLICICNLKERKRESLEMHLQFHRKDFHAKEMSATCTVKAAGTTC